ncbi:hypothetical protein [Bacteroides sp. 224]|nr:hypothetical protein [Bacteroides sp. 224]
MNIETERLLLRPITENDAEQGIITIKVGKGENMKEAKTTDSTTYKHQ